MKTYKALQNKAMRKGVFIGYAVVGARQWTTNGQIMVDHVATIEELKPLKNQFDMRIGGEPMIDFTHVVDTLNTEPHVAMTGGDEEWTNQAGLELLRARGFDQVHNKEIVIDVQGVYVDYAMALFDINQWYVTEDVLFATDINNNIVVVIAKVKELDEQSARVKEIKAEEK